MATIKDIQFSQEGEKSISNEVHVQQEIAAMAVSDAASNQQKQEIVIFKLVDVNKKGGVYIPNIDDVINPKTGKVERIRLLAGVDSIWLKDQKDLTPDYVKQNAREIKFPRGMKILRVPTWDHTLLDFMRITRHNVGSKDRKTGSRFEFFEYNPAAQQKAALEREMAELEMAIIAREMPEDSMRKHASYLGISFADELGEPKTPDGIRRELMLRAKQQPDIFKKILNAKEVEVAYMIKKAIIANQIDLNREPGMAYWGTGKRIGVVPSNENAVQYFTRLALTNTEEGREFSVSLQALGAS